MKRIALSFTRMTMKIKLKEIATNGVCPACVLMTFTYALSQGKPLKEILEDHNEQWLSKGVVPVTDIKGTIYWWCDGHRHGIEPGILELFFDDE